MLPYFAHPTACVDAPCDIGAGTKIWHFCHLCAGCTIGENCVLGQNVFVAAGVVVGNYVKIQNNVSLYAGTIVQDEVFLGPSCVLTNVNNPRAQINRHAAYETTQLQRGCTVGANATIVCGITLGRYAFVGAGAVVTEDVGDYALMLGVPARQVGYMSRHGRRLQTPQAEQVAVCSQSGWRYALKRGRLHCLDCAEEAPLPADQRAAGPVYARHVRG